MTFIQNSYGEEVADIALIGRELCEAIGGHSSVVEEAHISPDPAYTRAKFMLGEDVCISVSSQYQNRKRVNLRIDLSLEALAHRHRIYASHRFALPDISFDPTRPLEAIVRDTRKRLIAPAADTLQNMREYAASAVEKENGIRAIKTEYEAEFPGMKIEVSSDGTVGNLYYNVDGIYITGSVYSDGNISVQRLSGLTRNRLKAFLSA